MIQFLQKYGFVALAVAGISSSQASAWDGHGLVTYPALENFPLIRDAVPVAAEPFPEFLQATQDRLVTILDEEETWARLHLANYAPRPDNLRFAPPYDRATAHDAFMAAMRLNGRMQLPLFRALMPDGRGLDANTIPLEEVTLIPNTVRHAEPRLERLMPGEMTAPLVILATAADEPDYGLDIGLWSDNNTPYGKTYGFGPQPFGNPTLEFSTQSPFHMGFFYEDAIVYKAASFLKVSYAEMRIHQFMTLSRFAFRSGHPYWGHRFLGWGLHYLQDLSQPYHTSVLPGVATWHMLAINAMAMVGITGPKTRAIQLLSNRHLTLENFQWSSMRAAYISGKLNHPLLRAAANRASDRRFGAYGDNYPRDVVARYGKDWAVNTDELLSRLMPARIVHDPDYLFLVTEPSINIAELVDDQGSTEGRIMTKVVGQLLESFGAHTRAYVTYVLAPALAVRAPRPGH